MNTFVQKIGQCQISNRYVFLRCIKRVSTLKASENPKERTSRQQKKHRKILHRAETKPHVVSTTNEKTLFYLRGLKNQKGHPHKSDKGFRQQEILKTKIVLETISVRRTVPKSL